MRQRATRFVWEWSLLAQVLLPLGALGGWVWPLDFLNLLVPWLAGLALVGLAAAAVQRASRPALLLGVAATVGALRLWPSRADPPGHHELRLLVANVLTSNTDPTRLLDLIEEVDPDLIALVEVDERWAASLEPLRARWPQGVTAPRSDNFGVALLSRVPLTEPAIEPLGPVPSIVAGLPDGPRLVVAHTLPPIGSEYVGIERQQLARLRELLSERPTVVAGDLNATPWTSSFPLRTGWRPGTWPTFLPGPLRLPLDHVVASGGVRVDVVVGPDVGSDHRPLLASLTW